MLLIIFQVGFFIIVVWFDIIFVWNKEFEFDFIIGFEIIVGFVFMIGGFNVGYIWMVFNCFVFVVYVCILFWNDGYS